MNIKDQNTKKDQETPIIKTYYLDNWQDILEIAFDEKTVAIANPEGIWVTDSAQNIRKISALLTKYADMIETKPKDPEANILPPRCCTSYIGW